MSLTRSLMFAPVLALVLSAPVGAASDTVTTEQLQALRGIDARLAGIAYRLTTANAPLCRDLTPDLGIAIQAESQYAGDARTAARTAFRFEAPIAVEAVVPGAPAARAGVAQDDSILSVNGTMLKDVAAGQGGTSDTRDAALAVIARQPPAAPLRMTLLRDGRQREVTVTPVAGCASRFEVLLGPKLDATADGSIVQVGVGFFERYTDEEAAVIVAHELAHNILRHRARLDAAGVSRGIFAEIGRSGRLTRQTEDQADALGVILMRNAGYDPAMAVEFWKKHGGDIDGGIFRSRTHASSSARAKAIAATIASIPADAPKPYIPPILTERDKPLD